MILVCYYCSSHFFPCLECNCNSHSSRCYFDEKVYEETGRISGGVCQDCAHNTQGRNCQECLPYFYQEPGRDLRDPAICQRELAGGSRACLRSDLTLTYPYSEKIRITALRGYCQLCLLGLGTRGGPVLNTCVYCVHFTKLGFLTTACNCDERGSLTDGICESQSDAAQGLEAGRCHCKQNVGGLKCDRCKPGYWNYTTENPLGCQGVLFNRFLYRWMRSLWESIFICFIFIFKQWS